MKNTISDESKVTYPLYRDSAHSDIPWYMNLVRSETIPFSEQSQNDTVYTSSGQSGSFDSFQSNSPLALEAQQLWASVSRIRDTKSNCSSICSSASTLSSATICAQPQLSSAMAYGNAPSFDFMTHRTYFDTASHISTQHERSFYHAATRPSSMSVGTGIPVDPRQWHSLRDGVSAQEQGIEEYSLGSGYPG
jgi:hypothetical protein